MSEQSMGIVSFDLGGQKFCIDIMAIREIRGWAPVTPLPQSPSYMLGILNLRGAVIPVLDLASRLGMPCIAPSERSAIIVTEINSMVAGLLVDQVSDMMTVQGADLQPPPEIIPAPQRRYCKGVIASSDHLICFLELASLSVEDNADPSLAGLAA